MRTRILAVLISLIFVAAAPAMAGRARSHGKLGADSKLVKWATASAKTPGGSPHFDANKPECYTPPIRLYKTDERKRFGFAAGSFKRTTLAKVYKTAEAEVPWKSVLSARTEGGANVVPEPGSFIALSVGIVGIAARLRRRPR